MEDSARKSISGADKCFFYKKVSISAKKRATNRLRLAAFPIGCFSYLRISFSYCCSSSFRRGLNITRAMKKFPIQWEISKGIPEIHLVTAYWNPPMNTSTIPQRTPKKQAENSGHHCPPQGTFHIPQVISCYCQNCPDIKVVDAPQIDAVEQDFHTHIQVGGIYPFLSEYHREQHHHQ